MNWQAINFDWNQARAFLVTAETGSFSAAARALNLTQPTLGRQVAGLEEELGIVLFERVGRGLELTPSGRDLLEHMRGMGDAAMRVSMSATGHSEDVSGKVCISAADMISTMVMPHAITHLRDIAPQIEIELLVSNSVSDLQRREADIAVRHVRPEQPELIAKLLREVDARLFASTAYLDRMGRPTNGEEAAKLDFIGAGPPEQMVYWMGLFGVPINLNNVRMTCANTVVGWECAKQGLGVYPMTAEVGLAEPGMEMILPDLPPIRISTWLAVHKELQTSRRIRLVYDVLADFLTRPVPDAYSARGPL